MILLGVHTNMCVLGRPFGLRQMAKNGKNVVLMRDMTDTMYNPERWPYVTHFIGTELIVEHIEKFVCPTITSVDFLGGEPFRFKNDRRAILMVIGEDEYKTELTLPAFARQELEPRGFQVELVQADPADKNNFPGLAQAVARSDLVLISIRRRTPPHEQLNAIRAHLAAGKPLVGIRTASHAFARRDQSAPLANGAATWPEFDPEVLGGHYTGHHGVGPKVATAVAPGAERHPILRGVDLTRLLSNGSLYTSHSAGRFYNTARHWLDSCPKPRAGGMDEFTTHRSVARLLHFAWTSRRFPEPRVPKAAAQWHLLDAGHCGSWLAAGTNHCQRGRGNRRSLRPLAASIRNYDHVFPALLRSRFGTSGPCTRASSPVAAVPQSQRFLDFRHRRVPRPLPVTGMTEILDPKVRERC